MITFRLYQPKPGHPDWPRLMDEAQDAARRLLPALERPRAGVREWRRRLASYWTTATNYAINRRLMRAGREDLRPLYFIWTTTRVCNFACTYCDDHRGRKYPDLPNAGVLDTPGGKKLLRVMRSRTPSVYFAGGEPTTRPDLPELTRAARDLDYFPIIINTNGSLVGRQLEKPAWRTWLADTDVVIVSLDGLDLAALRDLWVTKRPHEVIRNLLLLRELAGPMRFKLIVNTVIEPGKIDAAEDVLDLACDLGIGFAPVPMNVGPKVHSGFCEDPAYPRLVETILERKRDGYGIAGSLRMNQRLLRFAPLNCRNTLKPHVDFDGKVAWPCKAAVNVPPRFIDVLGFDDIDSLYASASKEVEPTRFHGPAANQCGANCNWAQNYVTDAYVEGLRHPSVLLRDIVDFLSHR